MLDWQWSIDDVKAAWQDEGREEGAKKPGKLISILRQGKTQGIQDVSVNPARRQELYQHYGIE